jgi:biotin carboxyl carrier protein
MELVVRHSASPDREARVRVEPTANGYRVTVDGVTHEVDAARGPAGLRSLRLGGRQIECSVEAVAKEPGTYRVSTPARVERLEVVDPLTHLATQGDGGRKARGGGRIDAYMPGRVVAILVAEGDAVEAGQALMVLEAMKMQNEIAAERAGVVKTIHVAKDQAVEGGDALLELA